MTTCVKMPYFMQQVTHKYCPVKMVKVYIHVNSVKYQVNKTNNPKLKAVFYLIIYKCLTRYTIFLYIQVYECLSIHTGYALL